MRDLSRSEQGANLSWRRCGAGKRPGQVIGDLVELFVGGDGSACGHGLHQAVPFLRAQVLAGRDLWCVAAGTNSDR